MDKLNTTIYFDLFLEDFFDKQFKKTMTTSDTIQIEELLKYGASEDKIFQRRRMGNETVLSNKGEERYKKEWNLFLQKIANNLLKLVIEEKK